MLEKVKGWWIGEIYYLEDRLPAHRYKRHWTSIISNVFYNFYKKHWKWIVTTLLAIIFALINK
ncbi:MAG: hypothetical protein HRT42_11365 [Campylobacteraceae bacterium]|nr:hypothetical protein [Campylobacteraceae bacterium]